MSSTVTPAAASPATESAPAASGGSPTTTRSQTMVHGVRLETQGAVDVIHVDGSLNGEKITELTNAMSRIMQNGAPMVVCDLSSVQLMDSVGLEWLLDAADEVVMSGGIMKLAAATPLIADILRLSGVGDRFEMFNTTREGVGSFSK